MSDFNDKFLQVRDTGFVVAAALMAACSYVLTGMWALQEHNVLAMVLNLLGIALANAAWRVMGSEVDPTRYSWTAITLATASWVLPTLSAFILIFFPSTTDLSHVVKTLGVG